MKTKNLIILASAALLLASLVTGCGPSLDMEQVRSMENTTCFLGCNLFPDIKKKEAPISSVNYHLPGGMLHWGTPVRIVEASPNKVILLDMKTGMRYPYAFHGKTLEVTTQAEHLKRFLLPDISALRREVDAMSITDRNGINRGMVLYGMSKRGVLVAIGYPPEFATPDPMKASVWNYWYDRFKQFSVTFGDDGRVIAIRGDYPVHAGSKAVQE